MAVRERALSYRSKLQEPAPLKDTIHATVFGDQGIYVAECLEVAVVTQGRTLDELVSNLEEAIFLHLEGEDLTRMGIDSNPRLAITYEIPVRRHVSKA